MKPVFLLTSGGTKIKIDMVRSITNMSKGTFGSKIAHEILENGFDLTFLHAEGSKTPCTATNKSSCKYIQRTYVTFDDYAKCLDEELIHKPNIIILAAAVSDYGVENYVDGKIRSGGDLVIRLKPLPKLISMVREKCPMSVICGFKLLVNSTEKELLDAATKSLVDNKLDLVVGNDLRDIKAGQHKLLVVEKGSMFSGATVTSVHKDNLPAVVFSKCMEHWQKGCLRAER